jgi:redox-sensitive bicupin YhaK (pirin superfamily)
MAMLRQCILASSLQRVVILPQKGGFMISSTRRAGLVVPSKLQPEGAGVVVRRTIGTSALRHFDPFLMLDQFQTENPEDYLAGFPNHPHRGFVTFTYMINGHMQHRDSMGNRGELVSGGAQWMKAGSGVIHSEMPQQKDGLMRGFQLWINLPASLKMSDPEYQEFGPSSFPVVEKDLASVKVLIGEYDNKQGPIIDSTTNTLYLDVQLKSGSEFQCQIPDSHNCFIYPFEGEVIVDNVSIPQNALAIMDGESGLIATRAGVTGARFLVIAGKALNEPIVQSGPFVMNSRAEIEEAFADYQNGTLVRRKGNFRNR